MKPVAHGTFVMRHPLMPIFSRPPLHTRKGSPSLMKPSVKMWSMSCKQVFALVGSRGQCTGSKLKWAMCALKISFGKLVVNAYCYAGSGGNISQSFLAYSARDSSLG